MALDKVTHDSSMTGNGVTEPLKIPYRTKFMSSSYFADGGIATIPFAQIRSLTKLYGTLSAADFMIGDWVVDQRCILGIVTSITASSIIVNYWGQNYICSGTQVFSPDSPTGNATLNSGLSNYMGSLSVVPFYSNPDFTNPKTFVNALIYVNNYAVSKAKDWLDIFNGEVI